MAAVVDTHSHLQSHVFRYDLDAVLARAAAAGVAAIVDLGVDVASTEGAIALAERVPRVFAAAGCHPHEAARTDERGLAYLADVARHPRVVAVGEIGLDFFRGYAPRQRQLEVFRRQLDTAARLGKPVAVHCRDAHEGMLPILEDWSRRMGGRLPDGRPLGVLHYFSGDAAEGEQYIRLGFLLSIHTSVTHPNKRTLQDVARTAPLDRLVVETDAPYGAPQSQRGRRNEPALVVEAVRAIAALRALPEPEVARVTTDNARRLFGLPNLEETTMSSSVRTGVPGGAP
jgi:TatD DNase family protein